MPSRDFSRICRPVAVTVAAICLLGTAAHAKIARPACDAIAGWAVTIDAKDRWQPSEVDKRFWLPSAFQGPAFEALFGAPVTEWTLDDVKEARSLLRDCAGKARKAKRFDEQKAINASAGYIRGNLRNHLRQTQRAEARLDKNLTQLLEMEDSPALLRVLAILLDTEAGSREAADATRRALAALRTSEARTGRQVARFMQQQTPEAFAAEVRPSMDERYQELREQYVHEAEARLTEHPDGAEGLAAIDAALASIRETYDAGFPPADYAHFDEVAAGERAVLRAGIVADAKARIDALPATEEALEQAAAIAAAAAPSLDPDSKADLAAHAAARQNAIATGLLQQATARLTEAPATLDGMAALDADAGKALAVAGPYADAATADAFQARAAERLNAIAAAALPEFEQRLAALPDTSQGLAQVDKELTAVAARQGLADGIRAEYQAAAARRQEAMQAAIAEAAAEAEQQRQQQVFAAAKARIDDQKPGFGALQAIPRAVEGARRDGLAPDRMAELERYAAERRRAVADAVLEQVAASLADAPRTFEGLGQLHRQVEQTIAQTDGIATPDALARFRKAGIAAVSSLAKTMKPDFDAALAAFKTDREGLEQADTLVQRTQEWRYVDDRVRDAYIAAATKRRDEIAAAIAKAEQERRAAIVAAGGDPEIAGHTFAANGGITALEFVDERRVIFSALGMRFGGTYEIVKDDIFVEGPNGTIVFGRDGDALTGMGLTLQRTD